MILRMNKSIGGYFELELPKGEEYHKNAICLNTGRNAFEYVLRAKQYKKVYLPYYTCEVMLEPIKKLVIDFEFYQIDEHFLPIFNFAKVKEKEVFVYTNYFGVCDKQVKVVSKDCKNLVVDNSQAFFSLPLPDVDTFYSPRKFFGVPDGAYLYTNKKLVVELEHDISLTKFDHLLGRIEQGAEAYYQEFKDNDKSLSNAPIKKMSKLTKRLMSTIDYKEIAKKRMQNFEYIHSVLSNSNILKPNLPLNSIPLVYPYLVKSGAELKKTLLQNKIFVPTYWPNVNLWIDNGREVDLVNNIVCLPIDQRYNLKEMDRVIEIIQKHE